MILIYYQSDDGYDGLGIPCNILFREMPSKEYFLECCRKEFRNDKDIIKAAENIDWEDFQKCSYVSDWNMEKIEAYE